MASMKSPVRGAGYEPSTCGPYHLLGELTIPPFRRGLQARYLPDESIKNREF